MDLPFQKWSGANTVFARDCRSRTYGVLCLAGRSLRRRCPSCLDRLYFSHPTDCSIKSIPRLDASRLNASRAKSPFSAARSALFSSRQSVTNTSRKGQDSAGFSKTPSSVRVPGAVKLHLSPLAGLPSNAQRACFFRRRRTPLVFRAASSVGGYLGCFEDGRSSYPFPPNDPERIFSERKEDSDEMTSEVYLLTLMIFPSTKGSVSRVCGEPAAGY